MLIERYAAPKQGEMGLLFCVVADLRAFGTHVKQERAELGSSYVEGKVIVCNERNRRPLCLRISRVLACHQTSGPPTSALLPWKASLRHGRREQGGSAALGLSAAQRV